MLAKTGIKAMGTLAAAALLLALAAPLRAASGSLWNDGNPVARPSGSLFADNTAQYQGDIITIIISESTRASTESSTDISQEESMNSGTGIGILGKFLQQFGIDSSDAYETEGQTSSRGSLSTTISAMVVEVLPNGNLLIEASRSIVVNEETQKMVLSGVIRPLDISGDNTIRSSLIADAQIRYEGHGPIARRQRPGLLNKIFSWIF